MPVMLNDTRIRNATKNAKPHKLTDEKELFLEIQPVWQMITNDLSYSRSRFVGARKLR